MKVSSFSGLALWGKKGTKTNERSLFRCAISASYLQHRDREGKNNECFIKSSSESHRWLSGHAVPLLMSLRYELAFSSTTSPYWKASTCALYLCVCLRVPLHSNECQWRAAGLRDLVGRALRNMTDGTASCKTISNQSRRSLTQTPSGPHQTASPHRYVLVWVMRGHLVLMRDRFTFAGVSVCCLWHGCVSFPKPESHTDTSTTHLQILPNLTRDEPTN